MSFPYFPKAALNHGGCPLIPFRIFMDNIKIFNSSFMQHLKMELFVTKKIGNNWKLLLTVATYSFVLNVTELLDLTLKHR